MLLLKGERGYSTIRMPVEYEKPRTLHRFKGKVPVHLTHELIELIPREGGLVLDHGCGMGQNRELLETYGYRYIGIDLNPSKRATLICDAHHLPFKDRRFDFVISIDVLEHLTDPLAACREIFTVMKDGSSFLGIVAFLYPFHGDSYFHMTHLGLQRILEQAGFQIMTLWPIQDVLGAQFKNLFRHPRVLRPFFERLGHMIWLLCRSLFVIGDWFEGLVKPGARVAPIIYDLKFASRIAFFAKKIERG